MVLKHTIGSVDGWSGHWETSSTPQDGVSNSPDVVKFFLNIMSQISISLPSLDVHCVELQYFNSMIVYTM